MYTLTIRPYLGQCGNYYNIIMCNEYPQGPLRKWVRRIQRNRLSPFQPINENNCGLAIVRPGYCENTFLTPNDIPDLFSFLTNNGYVIDTKITKMLNTSDIRLTSQTILCFFNYIGKEAIN